MSLNIRFNRQLRKETCALVSSLTNFEENSENHDSCVEFAISNFCYHRFLDTDRHKISSQIKGLSEKFLIYSQSLKSEIFQELCKKFLVNEISLSIFSESAVHYGLLSILLQLADTPININYVPTKLLHPVESKMTDFDWTAYLLEGEDIASYSAWEDSSSDSDAEQDKTVTSYVFRALMPESKASLNAQKTEVSSFNTHDIVDCYWKTDTVETVSCTDISVGNDNLTGPISFISELHVMREIIWLFNGQKDLFVFSEKSGKILPSDNVHVSHITNDSLKQYLTVYARYGNVIRRITNFVFSVDSRVSLTYEAFATSLLSYFQRMQRDLLLFETKLTSQEETVILPDLYKHLSVHMQILKVLNKVFDLSIGKDKLEERNAIKATRLLYILYASVLDEDKIDGGYHHADALECLDVVLNLWLDTVHPYIDIIDKWITSGILDDARDEFVLQKSQSFSGCQTKKFWKEAVTSAVDSIGTILPWLLPFVDDIITAGKSMEILHTLSVLCRSSPNETFADVNLNHKISLYWCFREKVACLSSSCLVPGSQTHFHNAGKHRVNANSGKDGLLQYNFANLFTKESHNSARLAMEKQCFFAEPLQAKVLKSLGPILESKCKHANNDLLKIFNSKFGLSNAIDTFHNFHLMGWGDVMHYFCIGIFKQLHGCTYLTDDIVGINILLQEALTGRSYSSFPVFVSLEKNNEQKRENGLLSAGTSSELHSLKAAHNMINITNTLELQCKVEWPVTLILSEESIEIYNKIFSYLMQIKRAVFCMESLKFSAIYQEIKNNDTNGPFLSAEDVVAAKQKVHKLCMLRTRFLYLLQHWHGFVMTSVIHAEKHRFTARFIKATTLDDILEAHTDFLQRICTLCLLDDKRKSAKLVQATLKKIMTLAITFNMVWRKGVFSIHNKTILKLESDFSECSDFLGLILKTIANRGAVPILDSLAYAILR